MKDMRFGVPPELETVLNRYKDEIQSRDKEIENLKEHIAELNKEILLLQAAFSKFKNEEIKQRVVDYIKGI